MDLTQIKTVESKYQLIKSSKSKNKGGRPKMDDELKRKNKVILYFTDDELLSLNEKKGKKPLSMYIREKLLFNVR